jgi:hypothetical protein
LFFFNAQPYEIAKISHNGMAAPFIAGQMTIVGSALLFRQESYFPVPNAGI